MFFKNSIFVKTEIHSTQLLFPQKWELICWSFPRRRESRSSASVEGDRWRI